MLKVLGAILLLGCTSIAAEPPKPTGLWLGTLSVGPVKLRLALDITDGEGKLSAKLISIDQGRVTIPLNSAEFADGKLTVKLKTPEIEYAGTLSDNGLSLKGTFKQSGLELPLNLDKIETLPTDKRPQTPKAPFDYTSEDLKFENAAAKIKLAGTLTLPKGHGPFPVVVTISGSGPQDRDETLFGHKPFLVLADHLAKHGIACLRYDDRGVAKSGGSFANATSADFATDTYAAVQYLQTRKEIDGKKIFLAGHSEGGLIAPMVAAEHPADIAGLVLLAGPGVSGSTIFYEQNKDQVALIHPKTAEKEAREFVEAVLPIMTGKANSKEAAEQIAAAIKKSVDRDTTMDEPARKIAAAAIPVMSTQLSEPWLRWFVAHDPATVLAKVTCPILAINGEKDVQVRAKQNLDAIAAALKRAKHTAHTLVTLKNLNHLFQPCTTGDISEYGQIEETMSAELLELVTNWVKKQS